MRLMSFGALGLTVISACRWFLPCFSAVGQVCTIYCLADLQLFTSQYVLFHFVCNHLQLFKKQ